MRQLSAYTLLGFVVAFVVTTDASAHARFKLDGLVKPRTNDTGLKTAPCGGAPRTTNAVTFAPGQTISVEWEETVDHPGFFRLSFSPADDLGFETNILLDNIQDTQNDGVVPHFYKATVTLPNQTCTACTLQLIQVMLDVPATPTNYYSCSDIQLNAAPPAPEPVANLAAQTGDGQVTLSWQNPGANVAAALVLQDTAPVTATPTNGQTYAPDATIGSARVRYAGTSNTTKVTGLVNGTTYYFAVYTQSPAGQYSTAQQVQATLAQAPVNMPPLVTLETNQSGRITSVVAPANGPVIVSAKVVDANPTDTHQYDWSATDARLIDADNAPSTLTVDPSNLGVGNYGVVVKVTDNGTPPHTSFASSTLIVAAPASVPTTTTRPPAPVTSAPPVSKTPETTTTPRERAGAFDWLWLSLLGAALCVRRDIKRQANAV